MMAQYRRIKAEASPDTILFFRLGDFYEMFFDDAKEASRILDIALTKRNNIPMCGVPYHAAEGYLTRLVRAGMKVAICDQVEEASAAKGIVRREITRVVTPGTVLEEGILDSNRNNYLAGLCRRGEHVGLAMLDLSTGEFWVEDLPSEAAARDHLVRYAPSECIVPESGEGDQLYRFLADGLSSTIVTPREDWTFDSEMATDELTRHFRLHSLEGLGCGDMPAAVGAAGATLHYVAQELRRNVSHVKRLQVKRASDFMRLDEATIVNLELVASRTPGADRRKTTLLGVLDTTGTAMGGRLLREWLLRPLQDLPGIQRRHDAVEALCNDRSLLADLRERLGEIRDVERVATRLSSGSGNARDLRALAVSLAQLPDLKTPLQVHSSPLLAELGEGIDPLEPLREGIEQAIEDEPPITLREGGLIRAGHHAELDELREAATEGRRWLAEFQAREQERAGIKNLKVRHNKVFGYYIEITKSNLDQVPEEYVRKQTLVNAERFITPELKEYENKILGAQERAIALEYELFCEVREEVVKATERLQQSAEAVARLDVICTLAERALTLNYVRPLMTSGDRIHIRDGRHPVIEQMPEAERFVPNDALLDGLENQVIIITGPNMAGKSTYIRQVGLIVILSQMGSFVPAAEAEIGVTDRVFTRVGASDDLARGRSTFMVEMQETANILNNATRRSLIVLDEIGRGTSTFDGISIAWAVAEYLHDHAETKAKTLFATHYHELTDLALTMPGVKNYNVLVREQDDRIAFLRRIVPGAADKSYGIQVGRLAGLPEPVIDRAKEILTNLEDNEFGEKGQPRLAERRPRKKREAEGQLKLFGEDG